MESIEIPTRLHGPFSPSFFFLSISLYLVCLSLFFFFFFRFQSRSRNKKKKQKDHRVLSRVDALDAEWRLSSIPSKTSNRKKRRNRKRDKEKKKKKKKYKKWRKKSQKNRQLPKKKCSVSWRPNVLPLAWQLSPASTGLRQRDASLVRRRGRWVRRRRQKQ